jgi:hypothetical protein
MKASRKSKHSRIRAAVKSVTFGDLIAATYRAVGERQAPKILQLAMESNLIRASRTSCMG